MSELLRLIAEYRAGLDAEIALLRHLASLAEKEREVARGEDLEALAIITDARDQVMTAVTSLEAQLMPARQTLRHFSPQSGHLPEFQELMALHREATSLTERIQALDAASMSSLRESERTRECASASLEKGESTLAAYRRVVMPALASATLVNRHG